MRPNGSNLTCPTCGVIFYAKRSEIEKRGKRFCSMSCKRPGPDADRFWKYVPATRLADFCWEWAGSRDDKGYGRIWSNTQRYPVAASRMSWEIHFGPIPAGLHVCHRCDNPPCVNPNHLFLGTRSDNMRDMHSKGRYPKKKPGDNYIRGEQMSGAKLTEADVRAIRARAANGEMGSVIAADYPVNPATLRDAINRKTWRHVG